MQRVRPSPVLLTDTDSLANAMVSDPVSASPLQGPRSSPLACPCLPLPPTPLRWPLWPAFDSTFHGPTLSCKEPLAGRSGRQATLSSPSPLHPFNWRMRDDAPPPRAPPPPRPPPLAPVPAPTRTPPMRRSRAVGRGRRSPPRTAPG